MAAYHKKMLQRLDQQRLVRDLFDEIDALGIPLREVVRTAGCAHSLLKQWKRGNGNPTMKMYNRIVDAVNQIEARQLRARLSAIEAAQ